MKKRMLLLSMCLMLAVIPGCGKSGKQQEASVKASQSDAKEQKSQDMKGSEERASSEEIPANQNLRSFGSDRGCDRETSSGSHGQ